MLIPPLRYAPLLLGALACGGGSSPAEQPGPVTPEPVKPFIGQVFAGEAIAVTPLTLVVAQDTLAGLPPLNNRVQALAWADSTVGEALLARSPEVKWVLPPELRKAARRAPTVAPDPDRMGQSLLRNPKLRDVPDPLRGQLRSLMALVGGRYVMVPAALAFLNQPDGAVRAELTLVVADTRTGKVLWRTVAWGAGPTPARALDVALETVLPVGLGLQ